MGHFLFTVLVTLWGQSAILSTHIEGKSVLDGAPVSVYAPDTGTLVVTFLSARCPCSDSHIQELKSLAQEYPNVKFVGVHSNSDENSEITKVYFEKAHLPFAVVQDEETKWADQFKAFKTPHTFVMNSHGEVLYQGGLSSSKNFSRADRKYLREALEDIKAQRPVKTTEGRTLGCAISRKKHGR